MSRWGIWSESEYLVCNVSCYFNVMTCVLGETDSPVSHRVRSWALGSLKAPLWCGVDCTGVPTIMLAHGKLCKKVAFALAGVI